MKRTAIRVLTALFILLLAATAQTPDRRTQFHVTGQALPAMLGSPATLEGRSIASKNVAVDFIIIANTDPANTYTVTIQDKQMTPFKLMNAYPIAPLQTWFLPLGGTVFVGGLQWSASSTNVMGTIVGE